MVAKATSTVQKGTTHSTGTPSDRSLSAWR
jgi:hypothetical protein